MKRNILVLLFAVVLAFVFSFTFVGCKKEEAPVVDQPAVEEKKDEAAAPAEKKDAKVDVKKDAKVDLKKEVKDAAKKVIKK